MFGIGGERDLTERELPHLAGWRHSAPCGSATVPGASASSTSTASCSAPCIDSPTGSSTTWRTGSGPMAAPDKWDAPPELAPATRRFLVELADTAARRWQEKDHGIWEVRGEPRHFVYSKLMCWVALERATALADRLGASRPCRRPGRRPRTRSVRPS